MNEFLKWLVVLVLFIRSRIFIDGLITGYTPSFRAIMVDQFTIILFLAGLFFYHRRMEKKKNADNKNMVSVAHAEVIGNNRCSFIGLKDGTKFIIMVNEENKLSGRIIENEDE